MFSRTTNCNLVDDVCREAWTRKEIMSVAICSDEGNSKFEGGWSNVSLKEYEYVVLLEYMIGGTFT